MGLFFRRKKKNNKNEKIMSPVTSYETARDLVNDVLRELNAHSDKSLDYFYARNAVADVFGYTYTLRASDNYFASNAYCYFDTIFLVYYMGYIYLHPYLEQNRRGAEQFIQAYQKCMRVIISSGYFFNIEDVEIKMLYDDRFHCYNSIFEKNNDPDEVLRIYVRLVYYESVSGGVCFPLMTVPVTLDTFDEEKTRINTYINNTIVDIVNEVINSQEDSITTFLS